MKKELTVTAVVLAVISGFSGCSSYPETAEGVATEACKKAKVMDLEGMYEYSTVKFKTKTEEYFTKNPEKKERAAKDLKELNCEKVTETKQRGDDTVIYFGKFDFKMIKVGEEWKLRNL